MQASPRKTWVIPDVETPAPTYRARLEIVPGGNGDRDLRPHDDVPMAVPAVLLLAMTYLPGPLAAFVVPGSGRLTKACAFLFAAAWGTAVWQRPHLDAVFRAGPWALAALGAALFGTAVLGFAAWSRTVLRTGRELRPRLPRFPGWVHSPPVILALGGCLPGLGLLLAGRRRRAAWALWTLLPVLWCAAVIVQSPVLWNLNLARGWDRAVSGRLETMFIVSGAAGLCGVLIWIMQALDGMRLEIGWRERGRRPRSDWAAGILLVAIVTLLVSAKPASVAVDLDALALSARNDDLLLCPAGLTWLAVRLDPSRPLYELHLADYYASLGWNRRAETVRASLDGRWRAYEEAKEARDRDPVTLVGSPANGPGFRDVPVD